MQKHKSQKHDIRNHDILCLPKYPLQQASKFQNQTRHYPHKQTNGKQTTKVPFLCRYEGGVVHNLTPLRTHVGLIYNYLALLPSVIYRKFFSQSCSLSEKCNSTWHFHLPYPPRKIEISHFFRSLLSELTSLFPADEETSYVHHPHVYLLHITIQEIKPTI
jgi:hypothetical protein